MPSSEGSSLLHGTLDLLVLRALSTSSMHGYGVARWIERTTGEVLRIEEGSLYPALHRLARRGWVEPRWGVSENNRRARFYTLTPSGERQLQRETRDWTRFVAAVFAALEAPAEPAAPGD